LDLAIAVIIGAALSLVEDIFTPLLGMLGGLPDFILFTAAVKTEEIQLLRRIVELLEKK